MTTRGICGRTMSPRDSFGSWHPRTCDRPAVNSDPAGRCSFHIKADTRRAEANQRHAEKQWQENRLRERAVELAAEISKVTGNPGSARPEYDAVIKKGYTGRVTVDPDVLERLLELAKHGDVE